MDPTNGLKQQQEIMVTEVGKSANYGNASMKRMATKFEILDCFLFLLTFPIFFIDPSCF